MIPVIEPLKEKFINWTLSKFKTFALQKTPLRKWKYKSQLREYDDKSYF